MVAGVPWRDRTFWITQLLVLGVVGIHFADDLYGSTLVHVPAVVTLVFFVLPVGYASNRFGLRGSLPTAVWVVALLLPDILWLDTGPERWTGGSLLALVVIVAIAAGLTVDGQRSRSVAWAAAERLRSMAVVADQLLEGICSTDLSGVITYVNPAWASMQGLASPQAAVGHTLSDFHVEGHRDPGDAHYPYEVALTVGETMRSLVRHTRHDGSESWAEVTVTALLNEQSQPIGRLSMVRDVTVARKLAAALQEAEERFRLTFERAPLGMALVTGEGRFIQVNEVLCQMLGMSVAEVVARGVFGLTYSEDREPTRQVLREGDASERFVKRYQHADGHLISVQITESPVHDAAGALLYYVSMFEDVTDEQRHHQQLTRQAFYDSLTGLPNRLLFEDRGRQALARARRQHGTVGILFCDLDDFKAANDRFGHEAGDEILRQVAVRLQSCAREVDTVARFGGDEFVLLLDGLRETAESMVVATRICETVGKPYSLGDQYVKVGVSIGVAVNSPDTISLETLLGKADVAMYQAKAAGGYRAHLS